MELGMREPYIEGVAIHGDPESCVGVPRGRSEALTGARAGWAIEPRNQAIRGADAVFIGGRPHRWQRYRELPADPARSKNLCMHGISMCETREIRRSPVALMARRAARGRPRP
jgi:hypothetical protein